KSESKDNGGGIATLPAKNSVRLLAIITTAVIEARAVGVEVDMSTSTRAIVASASLVLAISTFASGARAGTKTRLWLEARPYTCSEHLAPLARELTLACDAAQGACGIAASQGAADRRLVVHCAESEWKVEALQPSGEPAWSVEVHGSDDDRARSAA